MAGDDFQLFNGLAHKLGAALGDIAMGGAVEAVAADTVVLIILVGDGVHICLVGHGLVEGGVEHDDHGNIVHNSSAGENTGDVCGVVEGGKGGALFKLCNDLIVNLNGVGKLLAAVDNAVTDSVDLLHGGDNTVLCACELVNNGCDSLRMGGHRNILIEHRFAADQRSMLEVTVYTDTLAKTLSQGRFGLHVDELVLEGGASRVDNKNLHY